MSFGHLPDADGGRALLQAALAADRLDFSPSAAVIGGTARNDTIGGTAGDDTIRGLGGNDRLYGGRVAIEPYAADGDDVLYGGDGDDFLFGGGGNDKLHSGAGGFDDIRPGSGMNDIYLTGSGHKRVGAPEVNWSDPTDGRNIVHVNMDGGSIRTYGSTERTHFDVAMDFAVDILSQTILDGDRLRIRAEYEPTGTTFDLVFTDWRPGTSAHAFTAQQLEGLFV